MLTLCHSLVASEPLHLASVDIDVIQILGHRYQLETHSNSTTSETPETVLDQAETPPICFILSLLSRALRASNRV